MEGIGGSKIFINANNPFLAQMAKKAGITATKMEKYAVSSNARSNVCGNIVPKAIENVPFLSVVITYRKAHIMSIVRTQLIGAYNLENVLAAASIGNFFGVEIDKIKSGIESYTPSNSRSQYVETQRNKLIVDAYNANASSMRAAIENFAQIEADKKTTNKTLILGDMLELGAESAAEHQNIVDLLKKNNFQTVFLVGNNFMNTKNDFCCFENSAQLSAFLQSQLLENQLILIKGSHGMRLEKTVEML